MKSAVRTLRRRKTKQKPAARRAREPDREKESGREKETARAKTSHRARETERRKAGREGGERGIEIS